jgi:ribosome recycling factor
MTKTDLNSLSIEELATLRDLASDTLAEKVAARQAELEAELERLLLYGRSVKKSQATPVAKSKKDEAIRDDASKDQGSKVQASKDQVAKAA